MKKNIIVAVAALLLAACSSPGGSNAAMTPATNAQVAGTTTHGVQPNDRRGTDPIIYVVDSHAQTVNMYDYPSLTLVGN
jgi:uncharacterized lipoprotein YajG